MQNVVIMLNESVAKGQAIHEGNVVLSVPDVGVATNVLVVRVTDIHIIVDVRRIILKATVKGVNPNDDDCLLINGREI